MEYATRHLYFPYTHEPLGESAYEENTSGMLHVPRYSTRKHCINSLFHAYIIQKFTEFFGKVRFKTVFEFIRFWKIFGKFSESLRIF